MVRTPCCDKTGLKKGSWTAEEDRKLTAYINRYGSWNWRQLPKFAGLSRCGKSCRLRWMNYLRPNLKRGNFSKEEEQLIIKLHESLGNRWSTIAASLPGRTDNEIKNYWHTYLKKISRPIRGNRPSSNNRSKRKSKGEKIPDQLNSSLLNPSADHQIFESSQCSPHEPVEPPIDLSSLMANSAPENTTSFEENEISPSELCSLMIELDTAPGSSTSFEETDVLPSDLFSLMADIAPENSTILSENEASPSELSSLMTYNAPENSTSFEGNEFLLNETFFEAIESFWTEPFFEDVCSASYGMAPSLDNEFFSSDCPFIGEELLWSYGFSNDYLTKV